jgi:hypothetical protein
MADMAACSSIARDDHVNLAADHVLHDLIKATVGSGQMDVVNRQILTFP